jgi:hypothetical protein
MVTQPSVIKHHTPGNNPKDYKQHLEHGESLKSRSKIVYHKRFWCVYIGCVQKIRPICFE